MQKVSTFNRTKLMKNLNNMSVTNIDGSNSLNQSEYNETDLSLSMHIKKQFKEVVRTNEILI